MPDENRYHATESPKFSEGGLGHDKQTTFGDVKAAVNRAKLRERKTGEYPGAEGLMEESNEH
jgi:hypothetical protein